MSPPEEYNHTCYKQRNGNNVLEYRSYDVCGTGVDGKVDGGDILGCYVYRLAGNTCNGIKYVVKEVAVTKCIGTDKVGGAVVNATGNKHS